MIAVGVCVALVVVAIGGNLVNKKSDKHLTVGASNFTEVYIVGNIYKELIEAKTDIQVDTTFGLASTSLEMTAMENGDIDMVVDYSGQVYLSVLGLPLNTNTDEVYEILSEKMRDDYNISVSAPLGYNNTYAMSVRPEIAEQYQLETLTDLMAVAPELRLAVPPTSPSGRMPFPAWSPPSIPSSARSTLWTWRCAIPPSTRPGGCYRRLRHRRPPLQV